MIPNYQDCMKPFLLTLQKSGSEEVKLRDIIISIADHFELTDEERVEPLPSGKQPILDNRVGWARTYLAKAGLIDSPRRANFVITNRGITALNTPNLEINNQYLKQFDEFVAFTSLSNTKVTVENTQQASIKLDQQQEGSGITPDEALRNAYKTINDALAQDILERTRNVSPAFFEQLLIDLLIAMGYGGTEEGTAHALGKSGDNGVDGVINQDPLGVDQIYIQAKRYKQGNNISSGDIRDFFGALNLHNAQKGLFITTSDFTSSGIDTAQKLSTRIVLVNGNDLARLMLRYNIGSRDEQVLKLKKIDEEFFEGF
ncbi:MULTISPECIES: restriction endonuclease [Marinomonas]|uniref:Restriction endonuclease n=1 Tax=Marinomonas arctica TaxID=383750 RepID=A0A7H1JBP8_9GAMM|nr:MULTISPECIES: restriction endonuclease [Marinomonas]MCS7485610.1 restriction endonuclease [Marinomonas sp. BSi20414]QNT07914.1 restriction endonuclease [Marinomonas arctica]GGN26237.1 restriction endonuclease [Marinomonas arctica]